MRSWWELYKKEFKSVSFFMLVTLLIVTAWQLFLLYRLGTWPGEVVFGLGFIPFSLFPLLALWLGYNSFRQEWKDDTIYYLLSLPRPGWQLTLSKLAAGMSLYLITTIFTIFSIYFVNRNGFINLIEKDLPAYMSTNWITGIVIRILIIYLLSGSILYIIGQFSQLISQFYDRFRGFISIIVFIITSHILYRGGSILAPLFEWAPDIPVEVFTEKFGQLNTFTVYLGTGPLIGSLLLLILIFYTGSWLLENHLEV